MPRKKKKQRSLLVLLLEDIPHLGQKGEIKSVKPGYFKYLFSQGKVALATEEKLRSELKPLLLETKKEERKQEILKLKEEIEKLRFEFNLKIGPKGQVFSPVTKEKILKAFQEKGIKINKSQILLKGKIKNEGEFEIPINLGYSIQTNLKIIVKRGS